MKLVAAALLAVAALIVLYLVLSGREATTPAPEPRPEPVTARPPAPRPELTPDATLVDAKQDLVTLEQRAAQLEQEITESERAGKTKQARQLQMVLQQVRAELRAAGSDKPQ